MPMYENARLSGGLHPCGDLLSNEATLRFLGDAKLGALSRAADNQPSVHYLPFAFRAGEIFFFAGAAFSPLPADGEPACLGVVGEMIDDLETDNQPCVVQASGRLSRLRDEAHIQDAFALLQEKYTLPLAPPHEGIILKLICEKIIGCFAPFY